MFENPFVYWACFLLLPMLLAGLLGALIAWFLRPKPVAGDLTVEGEGRLRAEADELRARLRAVEAERDERVALVADRDTEISDLKTKLAAGAVGAAAVGGAAMAASGGEADTKSEDETYALEWRNRYLAARVKYLEGRLAEGADTGAKVAGAAAAATAATAVAAKSKSKPKAKPKAAAKPKAKPKAKAAPKPKVLYTDGPTDGAPDDLKLIKGIGPKFEKDLNSKGIYYFRQIGNWKKADVTMVEGVIDSIPGRIDRDEWVRQAKGLAKTAGSVAAVAATKPRAKATSSKAKSAKPKAKVGTTTATKASSKAANAEKSLDRYVEMVRRYDANADRDVVQSIVKYCGVSLRSRDTSLVACSDKAERDRIVKGFASRKLGISDKGAREQLVEDVCQQMKAQRQKNRVAFYYLMAQKAGKLDVFGG